MSFSSKRFSTGANYEDIQLTTSMDSEGKQLNDQTKLMPL